MKENRILEEAQKRVRDKKDFFTHLIVYISTILFLFMINYMTSPDFWWFLFPLGGWGIGVIAHYFTVFGFSAIKGHNWEQKELDKEISKLKEKKAIEDQEEDVLELSDDELRLKERVKLPRDWDEKDFV